LKTEHSLWQLYTIEKDREKVEAELAADRESLQQVQEANQSAENELTAKKKEQSGFLKKMTLCEKSIAKKKLEHDKKVCAFLFTLAPPKLPLWTCIISWIFICFASSMIAYPACLGLLRCCCW
jgi:uncharacterized membrane protein (DUF106 family)